jgi:XTP/dITP diphosphohydrolase
MIDRLLVATGNPSKVEEIADEFREFGTDVTSPEKEGLELERPESGKNYHENARIKAEEGYDKTGLPSLADDSGLEVEALDGRPGIRSDRWAGIDANADEKNEYLLEKLEDVPPEERTARFVCEMVLFDDTGERLHTRGVCEGSIAREPSGDQGFGYDPLFRVKQAEDKTFAELGSAVKNWISHRARALNELISLLREQNLLPDDRLRE